MVGARVERRLYSVVVARARAPRVFDTSRRRVSFAVARALHEVVSIFSTSHAGHVGRDERVNILFESRFSRRAATAVILQVEVIIQVGLADVRFPFLRRDRRRLL